MHATTCCRLSSVISKMGRHWKPMRIRNQSEHRRGRCQMQRLSSRSQHLTFSVMRRREAGGIPVVLQRRCSSMRRSHPTTHRQEDPQCACSCLTCQVDDVLPVINCRRMVSGRPRTTAREAAPVEALNCMRLSTERDTAGIFGEDESLEYNRHFR